MAITLTSLTDLALHGFDTVIDARSPAEFADDKLPGAINLPVLTDLQRAEVGTLYRQSPFDAKKLGAALLARNVADHLQGPLGAMTGGWRPLVYCWRGGQRSGAFATILREIGWRVETLAGGYRAWRRLVVTALNEQAMPSPVLMLDGNTGTAKTELLNLLPARGVQVIDLEGLANHRGSLFGARDGGQPSQRHFEGRLAMALSGLDPARPVVLEAESSRIGATELPKQLWLAMRTAPRLRLAVPLAARADYLARAYADMVADPARLALTIDRLRRQHARQQIEAWHELTRAGDFRSLAEGLMQHHYDPRYQKHRERAAHAGERVIEADSLAPDSLGGLADRIAAMVGSHA